MLHTLAVSNYRSLRNLIVPLGQLTLITGPNGSGKSNVYRALRLLAESARGGLIASLAREGGFASTLWAGPESFSRAVKRGERPVQATLKTESQALRLGFRGDEFSYAIDLGLPVPSRSAFCGDPEIKTEVIWHGEYLRPASTLVERRNAVVRVRGKNGDWDLVTSHLHPRPLTRRSRSRRCLANYFRDRRGTGTQIHNIRRLPRCGIANLRRTRPPRGLDASTRPAQALECG